jgi:hypothetical protein
MYLFDDSADRAKADELIARVERGERVRWAERASSALAPACASSAPSGRP